IRSAVAATWRTAAPHLSASRIATNDCRVPDNSEALACHSRMREPRPRARKGRGLGNPRFSRSGADLTAGTEGSNREPRASVLKFKGRGLGNPPSPPNYFFYLFRNCARLYPTTMRPTPSEFVQLMFMHRVLA